MAGSARPRADTPAVRRSFDFPPQRLSQELITETYAHIWHLCGHDAPEQLLGVGQPGDVVVGGQAAGRAQPSVAFVDRIREVPLVQS